jgi:hypothetical protein
MGASSISVVSCGCSVLVAMATILSRARSQMTKKYETQNIFAKEKKVIEKVEKSAGE